ncbi:MAG: serine hydrolase [Bacteroidota bacterium]
MLRTPLPAELSADEQAQFSRFLEEYRIGGLLLPADADVKTRAQLHDLQSATALPLWAAMNLDAEWSRANAYPSLFSLAATQNDSLAFLWGGAMGRACEDMRVHLAFVSSANASPNGGWLENSFGADGTHITRMGTGLVSGLYHAGVTPCIRALPTLEELPPDSGDTFRRLWGTPEQLRDYTFAALRSQLDSIPAAVQLSTTLFPDVDSVPEFMSSKLSDVLLRKGLGFKGLLFSPSFQDSVYEKTWSAGEAELRSLMAGVDVLVAPAHPEAVVKAVQEAVTAGTLKEADLDGKVHRVLVAKAMAGLDTLVLPHPDSLPEGHVGEMLTALSREISEQALTLVRDATNRIPLRGGVTQSKVATLALGVRGRTRLQRTVGQYGKMDHFVMGPKASKSAYKSQLGRMKRYKYVVVALHPSLRSDDGQLPAHTVDFLGQLKEETRLVVANFGSPMGLAELDTLPCVVQAYDDREVSQEVMGQYIWGGLEGHGRLPVQVDSLFCMQDGLDHSRKIRLEYTVPEELGVDLEKLALVDSIIQTAIWKGTFPGCQVIAAKDGKVFFHKAYGHHDYDRSRRVRLSDVYDIASVTKIAATTLMAMVGYDQDTLHMKYPLKYYLEELDSAFVTIKNVTAEELMIHKAGLPAGLPIYKIMTMVDSVDSLKSVFYSKTRDSVYTTQIAEDLYFNTTYLDTIWDKVRRIKLINKGRYVYSDMSMFLMKALLERIYEQPLNRFVDSMFYRPMGLQTLCYHPRKRFDEERIVPTEKDAWWRRQQLDGHVHDPSTAICGGVGGQAGLFSNARDLATILQMLLDGGKYGGRDFISRRTVSRFTTRHPDSHRGLGFDMQRPVPIEGKGYCCQSATPSTFGHFGFTGTCAWADPEHDLVYVLLSNRVYPKARNGKINIYRVRQAVQQALYDALGIGKELEDPQMLAMQGDSVLIDSLANDSASMVTADSLRSSNPQ